MKNKKRIVAFIIILIAIFTAGNITPAMAAPANAISNELRATVRVLPGQTSVTFDAATMTMEPGYMQTGGYHYRSSVYEWLSAHVTAAAVEGAAVAEDQIQFITFTNGPGSTVDWQGYNITNINGAVISPEGRIGDNLNITTSASATVTLTALRYQDNVYPLDEAVQLSLEVNPYFTGTTEELNAASAELSVASTSLDVTGLQAANGSAFTLPQGASVYRLFLPQTGLTPENAGLSQAMHLAGDKEIFDQQICQINKRWPSGKHEIYIVSGTSIYKLTILVDHLAHDASKAISYVKAGTKELVTTAVRLSWAQGEEEIPVHTIQCGQILNLQVQAWATEEMAVRLAATWSGGTANHDVNLIAGTNPEISFPVTFSQPGNFDLSLYAELR